MNSLFLPHTLPLRPNQAHVKVAAFVPPVKPASASEWPLWAKALSKSKYRRPQDTGLGDTLVHIIGDANSARFKRTFMRMFGKSCGCTERQRWLNRRFPYHSSGLQDPGKVAIMDRVSESGAKVSETV